MSDETKATPARDLMSEIHDMDEDELEKATKHWVHVSELVAPRRDDEEGELDRAED